ncbi:hypothetical protein ACWEQL_13875 [Kitasatospora sp. NPDC004240]
MFTGYRSMSRGWVLASCVPALLVLGLAAYPSPPETPAVAGALPGAVPGAAAPALPGPVDAIPAGTADPAGAPGRGLAAELDGYRLDTPTTELPAGRPVGHPFTVTGPDGRPVTEFAEHQTKKLHFYAVRTDLTGFQHLHPDMAPDGTWTADLAALTPGTWRLYASFVPGTGPRKGRELVLSRTVTVPGESAAVPLPAPAGTATVDGYTVTLRDTPTAAGAMRQLTAAISKDGRPVADLQPYLDSYAHFTAFHAGDQALAHLHPMNKVEDDHGGPELTFHAMLGGPGDWRVFLQFRTGGELHTAELTLRVP